jgi:heme-degrading monooxygenase HmoA
MYAVIFRAEIHRLDDEYKRVAEEMRRLAIDHYGCEAFVSSREGNTEMAISYWKSEQDIQQWKQNLAHLEAQAKGRSTWYRSYSVQVSKIIREYHSPV